jgi:hypothetical protein
MMAVSALRVYAPEECGPDGYPRAWHRDVYWTEYDGGEFSPVHGAVGGYLYDPEFVRATGAPRMGVKDAVREHAGHQCVRCGHPYFNGQHGNGEWSMCWQHCTHRGPVRMTYTTEDGTRVENHEHDLATEAGVVVGYGKQVEARWRILTVHHLRLGADAKRDLRWFNLAALCQRCHLQIQRKVQMERVYPFEHTPWFQPYAAAWYAWTYLGEELTRAETMVRLDELLALERVA